MAGYFFPYHTTSKPCRYTVPYLQSTRMRSVLTPPSTFSPSSIIDGDLEPGKMVIVDRPSTGRPVPARDCSIVTHTSMLYASIPPFCRHLSMYKTLLVSFFFLLLHTPPWAGESQRQLSHGAVASVSVSSEDPKPLLTLAANVSASPSLDKQPGQER